MTTLDDPPVVRAGDRMSPARDVPVTAHRSAPDRTVFTETGNTDGWIASDLTVSIDR